MARVVVTTDDSTTVDVIDISNEDGPWTDGDVIYAITDAINTALEAEGDIT